MRPVVAHVNDAFFKKSETFIYHYVSNLEGFYAVLFANKFVNFVQFPYPEKDMYEMFIRPGFFNVLFRKLLKRRFSKESKKIEKNMKDRRVQLIHAHFGPTGYNSVDIKKRLGVPLITTFYGYDVSELPRIKRWRDRYSILFKEGDLFLVEGLHMKARLAELGCPEQKIKVQRIAIPLDKIPYVNTRFKKKGDKVILLFAGRFVEKKGLIYALNAIERAWKEHDNFEFRIIGDGPWGQRINKFVSERHMSGYVKMLGFLTYENYLKELRESDIFIHPSVTAANGDSEGGAPTTILEAQAMGKPVISTNHADIPNIVVPGKSAMLSQEHDIIGLSDNILYVLRNRNVWISMGRAGREFVERHHDIKNEATRLEEKYKILLDNKF